ncbi:MAG: patatin-like phospholipase family protein [Actinomycetota bacterium]|nr:patatin-like phospholipase family protein [Actinomycetota bacterium]
MTEATGIPAGVARGVEPVRQIPTDPARDAPSEELGLCLSGGGYRAMLFHLGALKRLNEAKLLGRLDRVSSVSGGSITAATLGLRWRDLVWREEVAVNLDELVVQPVRELARHTMDVGSVLGGALPFTSVGERVADAYREHLLGDATLQDLPEDGSGPRFVICATNLESSVLFRFSRPYVADWRVGRIENPAIPLADAVAASSAFPPVLSPFEIDLTDARWKTVAGNELTTPEYRGRIALSDGGVYDNLGLETVWKRCATVLVSDGGGHIADDPDPPRDWPRHTMRVLHVIDHQVRSLRKRQTVASYRLRLRKGAYWGIRSHVADYGLDDPLDCPPEKTRALAELPTRLRKLDDASQERLVNWGYAICDTAVRRWVDRTLPRPDGFPHPERGVG